MTDAHELAMLARDIDELRGRLALDRRMLGEQFAAHGGGPDLVDALLTLCDEVGAGAVRDRLAAAPESFQLSPLPPGRLAVVGQLLDQLADAGVEFDRLVAAREDILERTDPGRARVYPWFGREFSLADDGRTLRFADSPGLDAAGTLTVVPHRTPPSRAADADPVPVRRPQRDRER